jgi:hypothetical protein
MELRDQLISAPEVPLAVPATVDQDAERAARRSMRSQIARIELELSDAFLTAFAMGGLEPVTAARHARRPGRRSREPRVEPLER